MEDDDIHLASLDQEGRVLGVSDLKMDFGFRSFPEALQMSDKLLKDLFIDCRYVDSSLFDSTFWMPATGKPRCTLERLAAAVFELHTSHAFKPDDSRVDWARTGVEWWVQHCRGGEREKTKDGERLGEKKEIGFHWDKDEEMRCMDGIYVHAAVSTVTYLTSAGAPTLILDQRIGAGGELLGDGSIKAGHCSFPRVGKHVSFDARHLHAVPSLLAPSHSAPDFSRKRRREADTGIEGDEKDGSVDGSKDAKGRVGDGQSRTSGSAASHPGMTRVTFLANVWVNHRPCRVKRLPEIAVKHLSDNTVKMCGKAAELDSRMQISASRTNGKSMLEFNFGPSGKEYHLSLAIPIAKLHELEASQHDSVGIRFSKGAATIKLA
mmetsp:Transcript_24007/g.47054  ORF Transcript_24007/g.47054 Transcript_24007/m.47054 type:complete len:378 (+) Transcript_24007:37-1170(+)